MYMHKCVSLCVCEAMCPAAGCEKNERKWLGVHGLITAASFFNDSVLLTVIVNITASRA